MLEHVVAQTVDDLLTGFLKKHGLDVDQELVDDDQTEISKAEDQQVMEIDSRFGEIQIIGELLQHQRREHVDGDAENQ